MNPYCCGMADFDGNSIWKCCDSRTGKGTEISEQHVPNQMGTHKLCLN
jgi:hypothetical protein